MIFHMIVTQLTFQKTHDVKNVLVQSSATKIHFTLIFQVRLHLKCNTSITAWTLPWKQIFLFDLKFLWVMLPLGPFLRERTNCTTGGWNTNKSCITFPFDGSVTIIRTFWLNAIIMRKNCTFALQILEHLEAKPD